MTKSKKAFTLIELLVVIAIIGILATISIVSLSNARAKSRDAKRAGDMKQVQTALELFFNDKGRYPSASEWDANQIFSTSTGATSTYMQIIPSAPTPADGRCTSDQNSISYIPTSDGASYSISFCLGGNTGTLASGPKCLTPGGIIDIDCSGTADFSFTLTYTAGSHGSIVGTSLQTVNSGDSGSAVTADPDSGYHFVNWSDASTANPRTDTNVLANVSVTANFVVNAFACGDQITITTIAGHTCNTGAPDYDKCTYDTVSIGTQCWMQQNMNIGTYVTGVTTQTNDSNLQKYCYGNNTGNCLTDGGFYQWDEAMQYSVTELAQGICPSGWHIPTDSQFRTLVEGLATTNCELSCCWPCSPAGGALKEVGTAHWNTPNNGATNSTGFTALGTGYRFITGEFYLYRIGTFFGRQLLMGAVRPGYIPWAGIMLGLTGLLMVAGAVRLAFPCAVFRIKPLIVRIL